MPRNLLTKAALAAHPAIRVSTRTVNNWHASGFVRAYTLPGRRGLLFDLNEVLAEIKVNPSMRTPSKMHGSVIALDEPVNVVDVPRRAVVINPPGA